jgi:hypothetical protein
VFMVFKFESKILLYKKLQAVNTNTKHRVKRRKVIR